jgi:hypothetical protein
MEYPDPILTPSQPYPGDGVTETATLSQERTPITTVIGSSGDGVVGGPGGRGRTDPIPGDGVPPTCDRRHPYGATYRLQNINDEDNIYRPYQKVRRLYCPWCDYDRLYVKARDHHGAGNGEKDIAK